MGEMYHFGATTQMSKSRQSRAVWTVDIHTVLRGGLIRHHK